MLLASSGLCYEINCLSDFISSTFASHLLPYILIPGVSELLLALWLVVMRVNAERWKLQAASAAGEVRCEGLFDLIYGSGAGPNLLRARSPVWGKCEIGCLASRFRWIAAHAQSSEKGELKSPSKTHQRNVYIRMV